MTKIHIQSRYGVIPNYILSSKTLSFKAKGLFAYIQSKPDGWQFSADRIIYETADGRDSVKSGLLELEKAGYLRRTKGKNELGHWEWEYHLVENPLEQKLAEENPALVEASINKEIDTKKEIQININKKIINNTSEQSSQVKENKKDIEINKSIVRVIDEFKVWNPASVRWYKNKTQREALRLLIERFGEEKVLSAVRALPVINRQSYARKSTTPLQLLENWSLYATLKKVESQNKVTKIV